MKRTVRMFCVVAGLLLSMAAVAAPKPRLGYVRLDGEINDQSVGHLVDAVIEANEEHLGAVVVGIDSPGGEIDAGYLAIRVMQASHVPIVCFVDRRAYSMAFTILQGCTVRVAASSAILMEHQPSLSGTMTLRQQDAENLLKELRAISNAFAVLTASRLTISIEQYKAHIAHGQQWWLTAPEALKVGAVDAIEPNLQEVFRNTARMVTLLHHK